jgi:protein-disulfide isomerase
MLKFVAIAGTVLGGLFVLFLLTAPTTNEANQSNIPTADRLQDRSSTEENADFDNKPKLIIGDPDAPVTLVEYGDFKCPSCNQFHHQAGAQLREEYISTGLANIEFRNYPFIGPDSGRAARGAYCANDQGIFTEYHDNVYNYLWDNFYTQDNLAAEFEDVLSLEVLQELIVGDIQDPALFQSCMSSIDYNRFIDADLLLGADEGITGTPGFSVAGRKIIGPSNFNTFKTLLDIEL